MSRGLAAAPPRWRGMERRMEHMDARGKIIITGLRAFGYHGCTPEERERGQHFLVDLELEYDVEDAVREDELSLAVDYDRLAAEVHGIVSGERYHLIETLAARIGEHVMENTPALCARVKVRKPEAPMSCAVEEVAVDVRFRRHERD